MVYKRYITVHGKRYGPYLYESKRIGRKTVSNIVKNSKKSSFSPTVFSYIGFSLLVFTALALLFLQHSSFTGRAILDLEDLYSTGENLSGKIVLKLQKGELLPLESQFDVSLGSQTAFFPISKVNSSLISSGNYYIKDEKISGSGFGLGVPGEIKVYPNISFQLRLIKTELNKKPEAQPEKDSPAENESSSDENRKNGVALEEKKDDEYKKEDFESESEEIKVHPSIPVDLPSEKDTKSVKTTEPSNKNKPAGEEQTAESPSPVETPQLSQESPEISSITGAAIFEDEELISGIVSFGNEFNYELSKHDGVEIVSGSVNIDGRELNNSVVKVDVSSGKVIVSTSYFETERGFGERYISNDIVNVEIDISRWGIKSENGLLKVALNSQGEELLYLQKEITVSENKPEKKTSSGNATFALNETLPGNVSVKTLRKGIRLGEKVKWTKNVTLSEIGNFTIELPKEAENITVKKVEESGETFAIVSMNGITGNVVSGRVSAELNLERDNGGGLLNWIKSFWSTITGRAVSDAGAMLVESSNSSVVQVTLADNVTQYTIEYETQAPKAFESNISSGKQVIISGPDSLNYTDVVSFTVIPEILSVGQEAGIRVYWQENQSFVPFTALDTDNSTKLDYLEWVTPHLSNQTFNITFGGQNVSNQPYNNITLDNDFWHLTVNDQAPYNSLVGYWSFDGDNATTAM
ncbi:hypothetical protein FJZ18_01960, partial [Candidatus Pacearchaeota archaeon]|nr:hypothetical protein [Candidatus Pacearchaeota archaeon]